LTAADPFADGNGPPEPNEMRPVPNVLEPRSMSRLFALAVAAALLPACSHPATDAGAEPTPITDGTTADDASYDAIGVLHSERPGLFCTGTLISPTVVLTAKHCIKQGHPNVTFRVGVDGRNPERSIPATPLMVSPLDAQGMMNDASDVGLYALGSPITDIAPLPVYRGPIPESMVRSTFEAVGYGIVEDDPSPSVAAASRGLRQRGPLTLRAVKGKALEAIFGSTETLLEFMEQKEGTLTPERRERLTRYYDTPLLTDYEAYLGLGPGDARPCMGDSGGPLVGRQDGVMTVFGVVSGSIKSPQASCSHLGEGYATFGPEVLAMFDATTR
jgi:hypothetical protein